MIAFPPTLMPRGPGMLLTGTQMVPDALVGHLTWGAAYLGGAQMSNQIESLRNAGAHDIFLWAEPMAWEAGNFAASVAQAERLCRAHGLPGYIADPETAMTPAQAASCGAMLKGSVLRGFSVGIVSFPGYARLHDFADGCDGTVWSLCEIHNRSSDDAHTFRSWYDTVRRLFGRAGICIATYTPPTPMGETLGTPEGYDAYLSKLPTSGCWGSFGVGPSFMYRRLATWRQASMLNLALWAIGLPTIAHMPLVYSLILCALVAIALLLAFAIRRRFA